MALAEKERTTEAIELKASLLTLFWIFAKIGCVTFGGGLVMLPFIQQEIVEKHHWMTKEDFIDMLAVTNSAPGAFAINASIFIGFRLRRFPGALVSAIGTVLPSFLIIVLFAALISHFQDNAILKKFFLGVRPAVVALILASGIKMAQSTLRKKSDFIVAAVALILVLLTSLHPVLLILAGVLAGILLQRYKKPSTGKGGA